MDTKKIIIKVKVKPKPKPIIKSKSKPIPKPIPIIKSKKAPTKWNLLQHELKKSGLKPSKKLISSIYVLHQTDTVLELVTLIRDECVILELLKEAQDKNITLTRAEIELIYHETGRLPIEEIYNIVHPQSAIKITSSTLSLLDNLVGTYVVQTSQGSYDVTFTGHNNLNQLIHSASSDDVHDLYHGNSVIWTLVPAELVETDLEQQVYQLSNDGRCVPEGICQTYLLNAQENMKTYLKTNNRNNKRKAERLERKASTIDKYFTTNYPNGVPHKEMDKACNECNVYVVLEMLAHGKVYKFGNKTTKPDIKCSFSNLMWNHVDLNYMDIEPVLVSSHTELMRLLSEYKMKKRLIRLYTTKPEKSTDVPHIYGFNYLEETYIEEGYDNRFNDCTASNYIYRHNKFMMNTFDPYFHLVMQCTRPPCSHPGVFRTESFGELSSYTNTPSTNTPSTNTPYTPSTNTPYTPSTNKPSTNTPYTNTPYTNTPSTNTPNTNTQYTPDCYQIDMKRCFTQYKRSPYYQGFPLKPTHCGYNPQWDVAGRQGWWMILSLDQLKYIGNIEGQWTTPHLKLFRDQKCNFTVYFGIWTDSSIEIEDLPDSHDKIPVKINGDIPTIKPGRAYTRVVGMMTQYRNVKKSSWSDPANMFQRNDFDQLHENHIHEQRSCNEKTKNGANITSYIYAHATVNIYLAALKHNTIGIKVDSLILKNPIENPDPTLWHDCKPVNYSKAENTMWSNSIVGGKKYITKFPLSDYYALPPLEVSGHEFTNIPEGDCLLTGPGGTGKTTFANVALHFLSPVIIVPTKALGQEKVNSGLFTRYGLYASAHVEEGEEGHKSFIKHEIPGVMIADEITLANGTDLIKLKQKCKKWGIRLILAGDEAQLVTQYALPNLWSTIRSEFPNEINFKIDRRSEDEKIRSIKHILREIVLDSEQNKNNRILKVLRAFKQVTYKSTDTSNLPKIKFYNESKYSNSTTASAESAASASITVDSAQGQTLKLPHVIHVNGATSRQSQFASLVYSAVARFVSYDDIYIKDNTCGAHG